MSDERKKGGRVSNLGYAFLSQEYYLSQPSKTTVSEDVERIVEFHLDAKMKELIKNRREELESLVKNNNTSQEIGIFRAEVQYPGLVIGMSNPLMCSLKQDVNEMEESQNNAFKTGFHFDYVTGLPYISGSSIKGMLRASIKKYWEDVGRWLREEVEKDGRQLENLDRIINLLFGEGNEDGLKKKQEETHDTGVLQRDVFLDAIIVRGDITGKLLKSDYITPHPSMFKNPIPIRILALKPDVQLQFHFLMTTDEIAGIRREKRFELYESLILELGIGAKTNTGYGYMKKVEMEERE